MMNLSRVHLQKLGYAAAAIASLLTIGCHQSSHKSVRTYDYSEEPARGHRAAQPVQEEQDEGEWHMVAPGEMVVTPD